MDSISVVINVVEEELGVLPRALASVGKLASEIVVVDMSSSGVPENLVKKYSLKVHKHKFVSWVEPARNFGISKAKGEWVLILDPDEEITSDLEGKLKQIVKSNKFDYATVARKNIVFGKWLKYSRWWPDYNIRFFKKGRVSWDEKIHAPPLTEGKGMDIEAKENLAIVHHHYVSIDQYLGRMGRYTKVQAKERMDSGYMFDWQDLLKKPVGEFFSRYFFGKAYRDGVHGLAISSLQGLSELVVYLRVWEASRFEKKNIGLTKLTGVIRTEQRNLNYWLGDMQGGVVGRIRRKFKI